MKTIPAVEKVEWTINVNEDEVVKAVRAISAKLARAEAAFAKTARPYLTSPPYGTEMESPDGEAGMALGQGSVFCFNHLCTETHNYWKRADTTK